MKSRLFYDALTVVAVGGPAIALSIEGHYIWGLFYFIAAGSLSIKLETKLWNKS